VDGGLSELRNTINNLTESGNQWLSDKKWHHISIYAVAFQMVSYHWAFLTTKVYVHKNSMKRFFRLFKGLGLG
jgi:hypothetical protein